MIEIWAVLSDTFINPPSFVDFENMIDINLVREKEALVRENYAKRGGHIPLNDLIKMDREWRDLGMRLDELRHRKNVAADDIAMLKKKKQDASSHINEMKDISNHITAMEAERKVVEEKRNTLLLEMPNILHDSVPVGKDSSENLELRTWGKKTHFNFKPKGHTELMEALDLGDIERASRATGARFYYLKNNLFRMGLALATFTVDFLMKRGFTSMETPFMLKKEAIQGAIALSDFGDVIYKIEGEDLYLIATAEHTLLAYHMGEVFAPEELPRCYCGYSTNFRKEAGAHGKDTKGIFRVHQFDKVEQFVFCKPEDSWHWHENLIKNAEELYQALEIPYRVVNVCTGDMGTVAAKKYDLEAWMPVQGEYREVVSCSNCTEYQSRRLNIRYRTPEGNRYVHTLNSTAIAIQRTLVAILENFQQADGSIIVPKVLRPYMNGIERIGKE